MNNCDSGNAGGARVSSWILGVLIACGSSASAFGQCENALRASDGAMYDQLGRSVAISGSYAVVGAPYDSGSVGSVYVYRRDGSNWVQQQKLTASDSSLYDYFGNSVAIDGDLIVIGAHGDAVLGVNSGSAYVFKRNDRGTPTNLADDTWDQKQKLLAPDGGAYDAFGTAVGISANSLIVGAYREGNPGDPFYLDSGAGAAYIFTSADNGNAWTHQQKLVALDRASNARFGWSVAIHQNTALVGAYLSQDPALGTGSAYVFNRSGTTWTQRQKLQPAGNSPYTQFGTAVALHGDLAVVGDPFDSDRGTNVGSITLFRFNGSSWVREVELYGSDAILNERFGGSVAVNSNTVVAGAYRHTPYWYEAGAAYVFRKDAAMGWQEVQKLTGSDSRTYDNFGWSVGVSGDLVAVGSPGNGSTVYQAGAAYVMADCPSSGGCATQVDCNDDNPCTTDACVNSTCVYTNNSLPCDDGLFCNGADTCSAGSCSVHAGNPCASGQVCANVCNEAADNCFAAANVACTPDTNPCTYDVCNGSGSCIHPFKPAGSACGNSATGLCDNPDTCNASGVCVANNLPNGTACADDGNECTFDVCSNGQCVHPAKPNNTPCTPDGNACTNDVCSAGVCTHPLKPAGSACGSSSSSLCDNPDTCSATGVCLANNLPNGTACADDGNECTNDVCNSGVCTHPPKANNTPCDDGNICTVSDYCLSGVCRGGGALSCDDGDACTNDSCGPKGCLFVDRSCPTGQTCVDGDCIAQGGCNDGICWGNEDECNCPEDCATVELLCGNGICDAYAGEDCRNCPGDCRGRLSGPPNKRFCCGDDGTSCASTDCNYRGWTCTNSGCDDQRR